MPPMRNPKATVPRNSFLTKRKIKARSKRSEFIASINFNYFYKLLMC